MIRVATPVPLSRNVSSGSFTASAPISSSHARNSFAVPVLSEERTLRADGDQATAGPDELPCRADVLHVLVVRERRVHHDRVVLGGVHLGVLEEILLADAADARDGAERLAVFRVDLDGIDDRAAGHQVPDDPALAGARLQGDLARADAGEADHALREIVGRLEELEGPLGVNDNPVLDHCADQLARVEGEDVAVGLAVPFAARRGQHLGDAQVGFAVELFGKGEDVPGEGAAAKDRDYVVWHSRSGGGHGGISLWQEGAACQLTRPISKSSSAP